MDMKKNLTNRVLTLLMALAMIVSLAACGGGKSPAGTYDLAKMGDGSMEMTADELAALSGEELGATLELAEDNTFTWDMGLLADEEEIYSGTWKLDGDSLILDVEGEEAVCTYDGKTIVMDMEGMILTFEKQ